MAEIELRAEARERRGEWKQGVPGALALIAAIGFAVGIVDSGMREMLPEVLALCAVLTIVFGALYLLGRRSLARELVVGKDGAGAFVRLAGGAEVRAPITYRKGWYRELVDAGVARADVVVLFVWIEGQGGRILLRKALGAAFSAPRGWSPTAIALDPPHVLLSIESLPAALDRIGAERRDVPEVGVSTRSR